MYINMEPLQCTPETKRTLYANYTSIKKTHQLAAGWCTQHSIPSRVCARHLPSGTLLSEDVFLLLLLPPGPWEYIKKIKISNIMSTGTNFISIPASVVLWVGTLPPLLPSNTTLPPPLADQLFSRKKRW